MPFDNLENVIKEKVKEVEQSPVPKSQWDSDAAFLRVQNRLRQHERSSKKLYMRIAAVLLLGGLSGLFLYQLTLTDSSTTEATVKLSAAAYIQENASPRDVRSLGYDESKTNDKRLVEEPPGKAFFRQKQPSQRRVISQVHKGQKREQDKVDSIAVAALAAVSLMVPEPAGIRDTLLSESSPPLGGGAKNMEVVVVLGGRTLARMAKEEGPEAMALGNRNSPGQRALEKTLKKGRDKSIAVNRVKNPLSLNTEI